MEQFIMNGINTMKLKFTKVADIMMVAYHLKMTKETGLL